MLPRPGQNVGLLRCRKPQQKYAKNAGIPTRTSAGMSGGRWKSPTLLTSARLRMWKPARRAGSPRYCLLRDLIINAWKSNGWFCIFYGRDPSWEGRESFVQNVKLLIFCTLAWTERALKIGFIWYLITNVLIQDLLKASKFNLNMAVLNCSTQ